ncbi:MAG: amidohydrolase [Bacteroidales bacterium]|nr:amidohydrolase [Bacteroidales bacterium]MDY6001340.1 amidohydrolase [Candidatus Cryptobacteroides sp.]
MNNIFLKNIGLIDGSEANIRIADGIIKKIAPCAKDFTPEPGEEVVDCHRKVAVPGFVNMHTHAAMTLMRGIGEDMRLEKWLDHIWAIEAKLDAPFIYWGTKVACLEMIKTGTTTFNDQYWFSPSAHLAASEMGIRDALSYVFLDHFKPEEAERQKEQCIQMHEALKGRDVRSIFTIGIHAVYTNSEETILWATEYARKHGLKIHIHVGESEKEDLDCKAAHGGLSPVEYLDSLGVLGPDVIAAHTLWLSENDIEILGKRHVNCVHNINSNTKLSSGYKFKWKELSDAGANVCIGTDGCASSNNLDILEAMKTTALFQKAWRKDPSEMPLPKLLEMATINGAKAFGIKTGLIEEGYEADIQIIDTDSSFFLSPAPFLANFIYSAHSDSVSSLISGGKFVMRSRNVVGEKEILKGASTVLNEIKLK